jgi:hypothetical protein
MLMGCKVGWKHWLAALFVTCAACDDSSCEAVANQLRECCAKGPAELRADCESEAKRLEQDGNADACDTAIDVGAFARCGK